MKYKQTNAPSLTEILTKCEEAYKNGRWKTVNILMIHGGHYAAILRKKTK
jgi:hypothetical protein